MRDPVQLVVVRDPVEQAAACQLLAEAGIAYCLRTPLATIAALVGVDTPASIHVEPADLERARAVLAAAWGEPPPAP